MFRLIIARSPLFSLMLLMILQWGCSQKPQTANPSLNVMTFNIRYDNPDDGDQSWAHRKDMVTGLIRFHDVDLLGVQEALHHQVMDLSSGLPSYSWVGKGRDDGDKEGEYAAIFFRNDRLTVHEDGVFWLSENPDQPGILGWDAACPRICTWVKLKDRQTGRVFYYFNTHLDHVGVRARSESVYLIAEVIHEIAAGYPVILSGDFNFSQQDSAYHRVLSETGLRDSRYLPESGPFGPEGSFNAFRPDVLGPIIDFIFVHESITVKRHGILSYRWDKRYPSDHLPVLVEVTLK